MINIKNFFLIVILLLFPISIYLIITEYSKNNNIKSKFIRNKYHQTILIIFQVLLLLIYNKNIDIYTVILTSIPLLISYLLRKIKTSIFISCILLIYYTKNFSLAFSIITIEHLIYLIFYKIEEQEPDYKTKVINCFVILKSFLLSYLITSKYSPTGLTINNFLSLIFSILTFILFSYLILFLIEKEQQNTTNKSPQEELKSEKNLRIAISKLTHELKNPLAVCNGYLSMLDLSDKLKTEKYFSIIKSEIKRSLTIINDFSAYRKIKELNYEEIDIICLLEEVQDTLDNLFKNKNANIKFKNENEIYLYADYNRLKQVFINILKNSLESTKKQENLEIEIKVKEINDSIKIIIKDNGLGMNKETLKNINSNNCIFYTTKKEGSGIGVAYCQEVIRLHEGVINYKSSLNKGTTVTIILPIKKSPKTFNNK